MSLFKYGNLEAEIDFTDADFLDRIDEAKQNLEEDMKGIPKTGKAADIVRAQCQCFFNFFDYILGEGTHEEMFHGRTSLNMCIDASDMIAKFEEEEVDKLNKSMTSILFSSTETDSKSAIIISNRERSTIKEMLVIILMVIGSTL